MALDGENRVREATSLHDWGDALILRGYATLLHVGVGLGGNLVSDVPQLLV